MLFRICLFAAGAAALAGCAAANGASGKLANSAWKITAIDGKAAVSAEARLAFAGDRISASAGCNTMGGTWRYEGGRLIAGQLAMTEMYCTESRLMEQEQQLATLLAGAPQIRIDGDSAELRTGGHWAQLRRLR